MPDQAIAVTGANGRLGRAVIDALARRGIESVGWSRPQYDLDDPDAGDRVVAGQHPGTVIHAAAWTAVDDCARHPDVAMRRNSQAVAELASACAAQGVRLVLISTNEVFDGERTDGQGYAEGDEPRPLNAYGISKLAGEQAASTAFDDQDGSRDLMVVRTAWLFGPPGNDFPAKILAAADRLPPDEPLRVVSDEVGSPTYASDLADALVELVAGHAPGGVYHLVNDGHASRLDVARRVLQACRPGRDTLPISRNDFSRPSIPPAWGVLRSTRPEAEAPGMRSWQQAIDAYAPSLCAE